MNFKNKENRLLWESLGMGDEDDLGLEADVDGSDDGMEFDDEFEDDFTPENEPQALEMEVTPEVTPSASSEAVVSNLNKLADYTAKIQELGDAEFDDWMVAALATAATYVSDVYYRVSAKADFANDGFDQPQDFQNL